MKPKSIAAVFTIAALALGGAAYYVDKDDWVTLAPSVPAGVDRAHTIREKVLGLERGGTLELSYFRLPKGGSSTIAVIEGTFERNGIAPAPRWASHNWKNALLVNSVDEQQSASGGISGNVLAGCGVEPAQALLQRGQVRFHECADSSPYRALGIRMIANVAIVTWKKVGDSEPCISKTATSETNKTACVEKSVKDGLRNVFAALKDLPSANRPDALILPALGTGTGGLQKSQFYGAATNEFLNSMRSRRAVFPERLYLQEWSGDKSLLENAAFSIGQEIVRMEDSWREQPPLGSAVVYALASGACLALAIVFASRSRRAAPADMPSDVDFKFALGWILASVGAATSLQKFLADLSPKMAFLGLLPTQLILGAVGALLCGYLLQASDSFKLSLANQRGKD